MTVLVLALLFVVCVPAAFVGGWKVRARVPVRIPTNQTRVEDAKTDVEVAEAQLKRREIAYKGDAMDIRAGAILDGMRRQVEEYEPVAIDPGRDGTEELVAMLVRARHEHGVTQYGLSHSAGISEKRLREIFGGASPTVEELHRLAQALDLHLTSPELSRPTPPAEMTPAIPASFSEELAQKRSDWQ